MMFSSVLHILTYDDAMTVHENPFLMDPN